MRRIGGVIWSLFMIIALIFVIYRFQDRVPLETDFLALLPDQEQNNWVRAANQRMKEKVTSRVVFLISADLFETARDAARFLEKTLSDKQLIVPSKGSTQNQTQDIARLLFPYRASLLSDKERHALQSGKGDKVSRRAMAQIMSPFGMSNAQMIAQDPFLLFSRYLSSRPKLKKNFILRDGLTLVQEKDKEYIVLNFRLSGEPFDQSFQTRFMNALETARTQISNEYPNIESLQTGAIFYGQRGVEQAQSEATFIGSLSILGIILLNLLIFRTLRPLLLSLLGVGSGILGGLATSLFIFGDLHLMAFVFGAGLIGIAVDYTFHYCCEGFGDPNSTSFSRIKTVTPGLTLGVISSSLGFLILATAPFPGLQQIAIFSASGLVTSYFCVMCIYPFIDRSKGIQHSQTLLNKFSAPDRFWSTKTSAKNRLFLCVIVCGMALFGAFQFNTDDDIRRLQNLPQDLKQQEDRIRSLTGLENTTRVLLVHGTSEEAVLQLEEKIKPALKALQAKRQISNFQSISQLVPSLKKQAEDQNLIQEKLLEPLLMSHQQTIGLNVNPSVYGGPDKPLSLKTLNGIEVIQTLSLDANIHLIRLSGVTDTAGLEIIAEQHADVRLIDQAKSISFILGTYRMRALMLLGVACLVIYVFLSRRYGLKGAGKVMMPPVLAVVLSPFITAAIGESFTFFNAMALILVLAIGLDYALFRRESTGPKILNAMLANTLSATSTLLAFGLLALSDMYAIHAFGITILVGIVLAYILAPLAAQNNQEKEG